MRLTKEQQIKYHEKKSVLAENAARKAHLFPDYHPISGRGSLEERVPFYLDHTHVVYIPKDMAKLYPIDKIINKRRTLLTYLPAKEYLAAKGYSFKDMPLLQDVVERWRNDFLRQFDEVRCKYDFEYFAVRKARIIHKELKKPVPFVLRAAQRKLLHELERMRRDNKPIRLILLKARQWGGSTLTQIYMLWIQLYWRRNWNSVIGAEVMNQTSNIRAMYEKAIEDFGCDDKGLNAEHRFTLSNVTGSKNVKQLDQTNCKIYLGSMQRPSTLRSGDYSMAHYSEVGLWRTTDNIKPEDLIASINGSILSQPYTMIVMESTAKGMGNYFHREWLKAMSHENNFTPVFVAWWEIEMYQAQIDSDQERMEIYYNFSEYDKFLWNLGATLEGIKWYHQHQREDSLTDWQMHEEFPSTPDEAFISSGERVIPAEYMVNIQRTIREPIFTGNIVADGNKGAEALRNIRLVENPKNGFLRIWDYPDTSEHYSDRYVVSMDIGGRSSSADKSVIRVIDRYWRTEDGVDEFVATWRGNCDVDLAVWQAVMLAKLYDNALLVVESNTIDSKYQHTEGQHSYTVFDEIAEHYDNLYMRDDPQRIREGLPARYGFFTSHETKSTIITNLIALLREDGFIEHDINMVSELNVYEWHDGRMEAQQGCHDDVLMASAIGLYASKGLPKPSPANSSHQYFAPKPVI